MAITAKDALQQAREAMDLKWAGNNDRDVLTGIVDQLVDELATPLSMLQTVQVLWLPADTASRTKPVAKRVLDKLAETLPVLEQGEHSLAWVQALAWAALRVRLDGEDGLTTAILIALTRSGSEWCAADERKKRLWRDLVTNAEVACRMREPPQYTQYSPFSGWPNNQVVATSKHYPDVKTALDTWNGAPQNIATAVEALNTATATAIVSNQAAAAKVVKHIETHLAQPLAAPDYVTEPVETLWWGQSLYSPSLHESYRDLKPTEKLFWMAEDMAQIPNTYPSEARTAFFAETLRRVDSAIDDNAPIREHARQLMQGVREGMSRETNANVSDVPQALHEAVEKDPTGLPITFIVEGSRRKTHEDAILSELKSKTGIDLEQSVSTRQWARWVCRERLLLRFLHELVKE